MKLTGRKFRLMSALGVMILTIMFSYDLKCQNSVSIGTEDINEDAVLQLVSPNNNQGFLVPRLTSSQREAMRLGNNDNGILVYDTDITSFYYWHNEWHRIKSGAEVTISGDGATTVSGQFPNFIIHSNPNDTSQTNELQNLSNSIAGSDVTVNISDGTGTTFSINDADADTTNELQNLSNNLVGSDVTVNISNGTGTSFCIKDADADTTNEIITNGELVNSELQIAEGEDTVKVDLSELVGWDLTGNAGTDASINFIGTTDNNNLVFRTNNTERLRIRGDNGYVGIGIGTDPTERLHINGNIRIGNNGFIDDDPVAGGNNDDWIHLNNYFEIKPSHSNYGIVLRENNTDEFFSVTQRNGYSYLSDNSIYADYFIRGNGADVHIRHNLSTGRSITSGNSYDISSGDQFLYTNPQTRHMMYSAAALVSETTISFGFHGRYAYNIGDEALIPINVPNGARITQLQVRVYDNNGGAIDRNISAGLKLRSRTDDNTTYEAATALSTNGAPGYITITRNWAGGYEVVNENFAYYIWLEFEDNGHRFCWARITYTVTRAD